MPLTLTRTIARAGVPTTNARIYPMSVLQRIAATNEHYGIYGHEAHADVGALIGRVRHITVDEDARLRFEMLILDTPLGLHVQDLFRRGLSQACRFSMSGIGTSRNDVVTDDYHLNCILLDLLPARQEERLRAVLMRKMGLFHAS